MKPSKHLLGQKGEQYAVNYMITNNHEIIACNYRYEKSEIDIICQKDDTLVFCEVKSYQSKPLDAAEYRINKKQQQQIILGAHGFLDDHPQFEQMNVRFDVIIIDFSTYPAEITHHQAAFWLEDPFNIS